MNKLTGKGFLIWQLETVLPIDRLIAALRRAGVQWVCIKVSNGLLKSNSTPEIGGDPGLIEIISSLKNAGFRVGGWSFIFTSNICKPGPQAALLGERVQKLGIDFVMIDAEENQNVGSLWKTGSTRYADADTFVSQLRPAGVTLNMPAMLCSYRFPYQHQALPWNRFLNSDSINGIAQQLYWVGSDNPREQLITSMEQYDDWETKYENVVPIGAAFGEHGWEVTAEQITEFIDAVEELNLDGCGFWSLDYAIDHPEWLDAIRGTDPVPDPDPIPDPEETTMEQWALAIDKWARTMGYDGPTPITENKPYQVRVNTGGGNLYVREDKNGSIVGRLSDGQTVTVFPPTFMVAGYTRGEIDFIGSNRWIALEFTVTV